MINLRLIFLLFNLALSAHAFNCHKSFLIWKENNPSWKTNFLNQNLINYICENEINGKDEKILKNLISYALRKDYELTWEPKFEERRKCMNEQQFKEYMEAFYDKNSYVKQYTEIVLQLLKKTEFKFID